MLSLTDVDGVGVKKKDGVSKISVFPNRTSVNLQDPDIALEAKSEWIRRLNSFVF